MVDISTFSRSQIRYAIFRCRTGNPEKPHKDIYSHFAKMLKPHGLDFTTFANEWDVDAVDPSKIVSGLDLTPLKQKVSGSLFTTDGTLKDI